MKKKRDKIRKSNKFLGREFQCESECLDVLFGLELRESANKPVDALFTFDCFPLKISNGSFSLLVQWTGSGTRGASGRHAT